MLLLSPVPLTFVELFVSVLRHISLGHAEPTASPSAFMTLQPWNKLLSAVTLYKLESRENRYLLILSFKLSPAKL